MHLFQKLVVELRAAAGLFRVGNVFAQVVHAHAQAELVHGLGGAQGVFNGKSGHKTPGYTLTDRSLFGQRAQGFTL